MLIQRNYAKIHPLNHFCLRTIVKEFGLCDQLRVNMGTEWLLMLFVNEKLDHFRNRNDKPHLSSSSKKVVKILLDVAVVHFNSFSS